MYSLLGILIDIFSVIMLLMALRITSAGTVLSMIPLYQYQSAALIITTAITAYDTAQIDLVDGLLIGSFVVIPTGLILLIEPLLAQATVFEHVPAIERLRRLVLPSEREKIRRKAIPVWLRPRNASGSQLGMVMANLFAIVIAFVIAFRFELMTSLDTSQKELMLPSLVMAVSLSLLLVGILAMTRKDDLISQVVGLLVMEHGMFLGAIRLDIEPSTKVWFVMGLFVYTTITLVLLVVLLPELHHASGTIEVHKQNQLKG